jgi:hypothetical protein
MGPDAIRRLLGMSRGALADIMKPKSRGVMRAPGELDRQQYNEIEIDPAKFGEMYRRSNHDRSLDPEKLQNLLGFLKNNPDTPMRMPNVGMIDQGLLDIYDGKHRLALAEAAGIPRMTATIDRTEFPLFDQLDVLRTERPFGNIERYNIPDEGFSADELRDYGLEHVPVMDRDKEGTDAARLMDTIIDEIGRPNFYPGEERTATFGRNLDDTLGASMLSTESGDEPTYVDYLGSLMSGGGTQMMKNLRDNVSDSYGITLYPKDDAARGFYETLGMTTPHGTDQNMFINNNRGWLRGGVAAPFGVLPMMDEE